MRIIKLVVINALINLLFSACTNSNIPESSQQNEVLNERKKVTVTETQKTLETPKTKENPVDTSKLADGNYQVCKNTSSSRVRGWCFTFTKTANLVNGVYGYQAPKDSAHVCIKGTLEKNIVTGIGYELIEGDSTSFTAKKIDSYKDQTIRIWTDGSDEGDYLKVGNSSIYSVEENYDEKHFAWMGYKYVRLNLNNFYQRPIKAKEYSTNCPN